MPDSLFLLLNNKRPATLLKKRLWHGYFAVNFTKFLRRTFPQNTSGRLVLSFEKSFINNKKRPAAFVDLRVLNCTISELQNISTFLKK